MIILFKILFEFLYVCYGGIGIVGIVLIYDKHQKIEKWHLVIPIIGYVFSLLIFQLYYYFFESSYLSFYLTIISLTIVNLVYLFLFLRSENSFKKFLENFRLSRYDLYLILVLLSIFFLSSWQYIGIGERNYLHSGNEDFLDGVNGGQSYLDNVPLSYMPEDFSGWIRLQYSSQAFTRILLNVSGVDGFLFQAILNLFLMAVGIYWLVNQILKGNEITALLAGFWSVCANFYLTTFLNGHIGSMMYGAMVPMFLGLIISLGRKEINFVWLFIVIIFFYAIHITYPGPIYFLLIPAVLLILYDRFIVFYKIKEKFLVVSSDLNNIEKKIKYEWTKIIFLGILSLVLFVVVTILVYNYFEPRRIQAVLRTNVSWKISLFKEMFMIFWGIYPSGSTGILSALPILISNEIINTITLIISMLLTFSVFYLALKNRKNKNRQFLFLYAIFFPLFFIIMRYFWGSPYYFYKFLYVNYFIVIVIIFLGVSDLYSYLRTKIIGKISIGVLVFVGVLNIVWDLSITYDFYTRPYNDKTRISDFFAHVTKEKISQSYIDIPNFLYDLDFRYIFKDNGYSPLNSRVSAKYLIQLVDLGNVYNNSISKSRELFNNGLLKISEPPLENYISTTTMYEPEHAGNININWVGNDLSLKRGILASSLDNLAEFVGKSGNQSNTFIDITDRDTYILLFESLKERGIKLQNNALNADWFIRIKGGKPIISEKNISQKIWNNEFFEIIRIGKDQSKLVNDLPEIPNFSGLVNKLKINGSKVFLDLPHTEHAYFYLKQFLKEQNIDVVDNPSETKNFCRFIFNRDYEKYNYKVYTHPEETILWQSESFNIFQRPWEVQLVKVPFQNRIINLNSSQYSSLPFNIATKYSKGDYQIKLAKLTTDAFYLRILISPGPSVDFSPFKLKIINADNSHSEEYEINSPMSLIDIKIKDFKNEPDTTLELFLEGKNLIGKSLLPLDDRYLNYQVQAIELTDNVDYYSNFLLNVFNNKVPSRLDKFINLFISEKNVGDIINKIDSNHVCLGIGWYPVEENNNQIYRWVGVTESEVVLKNVGNKHRVLEMELEPGPGCGNDPLFLKEYIGKNLFGEIKIVGRQKIIIDLSKETIVDSDNQITLKLNTDTANRKMIGDPRILNYRVFSISLKKYDLNKNDIINSDFSDQIQLGKGWYPYETFNNESFRWVGKDKAEILIDNSDTTFRKIKISLEPGPGCAGKPLQLNVIVNNILVAKKLYIGKDILVIDLKEQLKKSVNGPINIKLQPVSKNAHIKGENRILNFRVFNMSLIN